MTPLDAAKLLEVAPDATPEQIEARFLALQAKLEDKIAKAPTPGLKAKYRETLAEITTAFETLTLAADSSALPVLRRADSEVRSQKSEAGSSSPASAGPTAGRPPSAKRSGGREFALIAVIAVAVLGAGGWFVMKTRAENAEQERVAAEAKAAAEQKVAADKKAADEARIAKDAAEKAEKDRLDKLFTQLRTRLAELNVAYEAALRTEQMADRALSDLKSQERDLARGGPTPESREVGAKAQAQERFATWLRDTLGTHPARIAKAKTDELISSRIADEAVVAVEQYDKAIQQLQAEIAVRRTEMLTLTGTLLVTAEPAGVDFTLQDAYGRTRTGRAPAELTDVPFGSATVAFQRSGWPALTRTAVVKREAPAAVSADLAGGSLSLASKPFPVDFTLTGQGRTEKGRTPATFAELPVGTYQITYSRPGWPAQTLAAEVRRGQASSNEAGFAAPGSARIQTTPAGAAVSVGGRIVGTTPLTIPDLPPGELRAEITLADFRPVALQGTVAAGAELALSATLRSATLTPEEAYEKLAKEAQGTWVHDFSNALTGSQRLYLRFVAGSRVLSFEQTGFGGSVRNMTMVEYDAKNRAVLVAFGGLDAINGKIAIRMEGDSLLFGKDLANKPTLFRRQ